MSNINEWTPSLVGKKVLFRFKLGTMHEARVLEISPGGRVKLALNAGTVWHEPHDIELVEVLPGEPA